MSILQQKEKLLKSTILNATPFKIISAIIISLFSSELLRNMLWLSNKDFAHTVLELTSVCIGVATFMVIWSKQEKGTGINDILGFGFLVVSIFDFMHTYYYKGLITTGGLSGEISIRFWLLARFTEVAILTIFSFFPYFKSYNKYMVFVIALLVSSIGYYITHLDSRLIPVFLNGQACTDIKIALEYTVILMAILCIIKLRNSVDKESFISFKSLYVCIFLIIPSEVCFTLYNSSSSFWVVLGHVLKVTRYCYLYKAVFESSVRHPYIKLDENNKRLSDILNALPISVHTYDRDNRIDFVNSKFEEIFKYPREELIGLNDKEFLKLLRKIGHENENTLPNRVYNGEGDTNNIIRSYLNGDGEEVKVLLDAHKVNGGILVVAADVKQQQEIRNLNLQAQAILNASTVPTMILDENEIITACNSSLADLVEIDYSQIVGITVDKLMKKLKFVDKESNDSVNHDNSRNRMRTWTIETSNNNKKQIQTNTSDITNIYGEKIGTVTVMQDISKLKENQLKLINQEKLALLGQMGATIVHETRNFLTTIKGNSQLIEMYVNDEKLKQYARKINIDTNEVNRIISDFLNLSKPRETELEEVAFNDLINSMKSTIETSSIMSKVQLVLDLDYDERYILCDETQMRQVILNICKNAVEAMSETENPIMRIATGLDEDKCEVFIKISDNGKGIHRDLLKKIGTPFFTTKKSGTGLGLNACFQIIREHKGRIDIESEVGKGTTFIIAIPYIEEDWEDIV